MHMMSLKFIIQTFCEEFLCWIENIETTVIEWIHHMLTVSVRSFFIEFIDEFVHEIYPDGT